MVTGPITQDEIINIKRSRWADNFFRPLLLTTMIMCLNISVVNLVRLANPTWRGTYLLGGMLLTTVEAIYSYRVLQHHRSRGVSVLRYRLAEATLLIIVLKLLSFMAKPLDSIGAELQAMWQSPVTFFNLEFYVILVLASLTWGAATQTIADFEALHDPYSDNRMPLNSLAERFFWGGGLLVVISGITQWVARSGAASLIDWQRPALSGVIFNVLVYFMLGLALLSQVNLTTLLVRWRIQKITVAPGLVRRWAKYGLIFLGLITLIAFSLPTGYSLGLLSTVGFAIIFLIRIVIFIFQLLLVLLSLPLSWLLGLFGVTSAMTGGPRALPPPPLLPTGESTPVPPWLEVLRSLVFWLLAIAIAGYLLKSYLEDHPELLTQLKRLKLIGPLIKLLIQLWTRLLGWTQAGLQMLPTKAREGQQGQGIAPAGQILDWLGLRRLAPRERILAYYLNILKRAADKGLARKQFQTPYEYESNLERSAPDVQTEIHLLTDVFVHARYSQERFSEEQVALVKVLWQRIRKALRQK